MTTTGFTDFFVSRPVATLLLSVGLFLVGVVAFFSLPVAPLPRVEFPTIAVSAKLPGANPETMAETVAAPLERRLGQISGVTEITSVNSQGSANITIQFDLDRDIQGAAHDVEAALNATEGDLPVDLPSPPTYRKLNPSDAPVIILAVTSQTLTPGALYDASDSILAQRISQIEGVAQVTVSGADKPAVRVQVDPARLASTGLSMEDVRGVIASSNANQPKGSIDNGKQNFIIRTNDQISAPQAYAPLVLKTKNGQILRLSDIATVKRAPENVRQAGWFNLGPAIILIIQKQGDANVIETVDRIKAALPQLQSWMPAGTKVNVLSDRTQTIRASVHDVEITLLISITLVVLVVLFSLGRVTPTLAASITVPLSLAGTFAAMWMLGYSINNISLMALIVSVGFVVDDAIVMIENIARHVERGESPVVGAVKGAQEITFTIISITVSLLAVFIPLLFMGGILGRLFREFAMTLSVAVAISGIISITVTPTIYAHLMRNQKSHKKASWIAVAGEKTYGWLQKIYEHGLVWVLRFQRLTLFVMFLTIALTIYLYGHVSKGFFPQQDTGMILGTTDARNDISFKAMGERQQRAAKIILDDPAVAGLVSSIGAGGFNASTNHGRIFVSLKPLSERKVSAEDVINRVRPKLAKIEGINTFLQPAQDVRAGGRPSKAQFQFSLQAESLDDLQTWMPKLINQLKNEKGFTDVSSDQDSPSSQIDVVVDRDKAARLNVDITTIDQVLQDAFAQRQVSVIYAQRNQYHAVLEVDPKYQESPASLDSLYIKSSTGQTVRLGAVARFEYGLTPLSINHQGQYPAATLTFNLPPGASLGDATERLKAVSNQMGMLETIHMAFAGNAKAFADSLKDEPILIGAALLAIYIVLGILYEHTLHPLTILSTLPSAGLGALLALMITGNDLSLISVIGIILLMGIVKKNGIMLVDFAIMAERTGMAAEQAIVEACKNRFRPILMTTLAAVFGAVPLILATGNGAELRRPLGVAIVGGLIVSQLLTLYTTPVVYLALDRISERRRLKREARAMRNGVMV